MFAFSSVIVGDLDFVGVAFMPHETDSPRHLMSSVRAHRPTRPPSRLSGSLAELVATGVLERVETFGDRAPKHVGVDIVVIVAKHAAELTEFREFHFRIFGVKRVTEFSRGFANAFQAAFHGVLCLGVGDQLLPSHTADVGTDPRNVVEDIA